MFGTGDLPVLFQRPELFANKFQLNRHPVAYQCVEELILKRSRIDLPLYQSELYRQMPFLSTS